MLGASCSLVAACGGEGTDVDDIVSDYIEAVRAGDAEKACGLTSQTVEEARFRSKCEPPELGTLAELDDQTAPENGLSYQPTFAGDRATVVVLDDDGERTNDFSMVVENGDWKVIGTYEALDRPAMDLIPAVEDAMEELAKGRPGHYEGLTAMDLAMLGNGSDTSQLAISQATPTFYVANVMSFTGATYSVVADWTGVRSYPCTPVGIGACPRSGYWQESKVPRVGPKHRGAPR